MDSQSPSLIQFGGVERGHRPIALLVFRETVLFVSSHLHAERRRRGTRTGTRALGCFKQAILVEDQQS
ncbi:hypothetical protein KZZ52_16050 [Dactylosporangium sp. AC04546]|uniref:hypothetical protein n=1 Tax=Dactylosporangium sp. AC04546 TaxID=2862460 RepID=UPI001EDFE05C|nr:hypothetical protein [Dactylosporangium sp. AC04546]WVK89906.1 hypothetical protein KZZ52_16050 [Dactylosporangium sp. AC04546]